MQISISRLKTFKACRRAYYFKYMENLEPIQKAEALETGGSYHKLLEELNTTGQLPECDFSKEYAMAKAYEKYIYPRFKVVEAEKYLEYDLGDGDNMIGYADGIADDGHIVEHKSTSSEITEQYEYNLLWDEQILAYMLMTEMRKVWYTVCRKPSIRQKQNETESQFYQRMLDWYDEDTESKIRLLEIERTDEEVEQFRKELIETLEELHNSKSMYRNCLHCFRWGRQCEYAPICLSYEPEQEYAGFTKVERSTYGVSENK